jgi:anti-sigma regulatory factor (Ser/Thr protein kinase)
MENQLALQTKNSIEEIPVATAQASSWLLANAIPKDVVHFVCLAIEELVSNCVKYGYDDALEHVIEIVIGFTGSHVAVSVIDDGHPFNPLDLPAPDVLAPVEDRPIGGLGIHLLRKMADHFEYERSNSKNKVTLVKNLSMSDSNERAFN